MAKDYDRITGLNQTTVRRLAGAKDLSPWLSKQEAMAGSKRPTTCDVCFCNSPGRSIAYDHDHHTGKFRGWLCNRCNLVLGLVCDEPLILQALERYLATRR